MASSLLLDEFEIDSREIFVGTMTSVCQRFWLRSNQQSQVSEDLQGRLFSPFNIGVNGLMVVCRR